MLVNEMCVEMWSLDASKPSWYPFAEGVGDVARGFVARDGVGGGVGARRAGHLVILPVALIDFDERLHRRVVVAPVRALIGGAGVRRGDAAEEMQIGVQHRGIGRGRAWTSTAETGRRGKGRTPRCANRMLRWPSG